MHVQMPETLTVQLYGRDSEPISSVTGERGNATSAWTASSASRHAAEIDINESRLAPDHHYEPLREAIILASVDSALVHTNNGTSWRIFR